MNQSKPTDRGAIAAGGKTLRALPLLLAMLCLVGCYTAPFAPMPKAVLSEAVPKDVVTRFDAELTPQFQQLQSVTFQFIGKELVAMGVLDVDRRKSTFKLACLTHVGAKLFDLTGDQTSVKTEFIAPMFGERSQEIATAVGQDVQRAYFNWIPIRIDSASPARYKLTLSRRLENGRTDYVFAGPDRRLVEKRVYANGSRVCKINYYEYEHGSQGIYPQGIVLKNDRYHYRLIIRVKQELGPASASPPTPHEE